MAVRRFKLSDNFIEPYRTKVVPWGFNGVGLVTYKRTYSRALSETEPGATGTEDWYQTCRRVIEGMFSIQKRHVQELGLEWNDAKAQRTAKDAYDRMFHMKWLPPGRGIWMMGTDFIENRTGAGAFNCGMRSTKDLTTKNGYLWQWVMDALMLGVGVGFDTLGAGTLVIKEPGSVPRPNNYFTEHIQGWVNEWVDTPSQPGSVPVCRIADSREGWVQAIRVLLDCFYLGYGLPVFDYSKIRAAGESIRGFGGTSSGPGPLIQLVKDLTNLYYPAIGQLITSVQIVDTENFIGKCVVAGNVRRSAALALGDKDDRQYLTMKNDQQALQDRRWGSNNSFHAVVGQDYTWHAEQSQKNGEPGYIWLDNARTRGRFKDGVRLDDQLVSGFNPCVEQQLEDGELCCLVETFPALHESYEDYLQTLKIAYLYGKTVTLLRTHWPETNAVMQKNRRIGLSQSGVVQAMHKHGRRALLSWCDQAYTYIQQLDAKYSDWLCIPRSKRTTSIKPSGTVSLLNGSTPGIHYPEDQYYIRRIRIAESSPLLVQLLKSGYPGEPVAGQESTWVVEFPVEEPLFVRGKRDVSMWEQLELAAAYQYWWADNSVSVTVTFKPEEASSIKHALELYETRLKAVSFLRYEETGYVQAPYEPITKERYEQMMLQITPITSLDSNEAGGGTAFCDSSGCSVDWGSSALTSEPQVMEV